MQYLYDLNDPKNFIEQVDMKRPDGRVFEHQHTILMPENPRRNFCMTDSIMLKSPEGSPPAMHVHRESYEIFFVDSGGMDSYVNGQKAYVKPGSILFYQPFQAHGAYFHENVKFRGFFHDRPYYEEGDAYFLLHSSNPDFLLDPELPLDNLPMKDFIDRETPYNYKEVPPEQCSCIRHRERPMAQFNLEGGCTAKMLTGRWENSGLCEMWCFEMKKGFSAESDKYPKITDLYYVTEGEIKFRVYNEEFIAKTEHVVKIPRWTPRRFEALTDAVMYDVGGMPMWYSYFLDRESIHGLAPERAKDPKTWETLRKKFDIHYKL